MGNLPRKDTRKFTTGVVVTCQHTGCGATAYLGPGKRNDLRHPGIWCDGPVPEPPLYDQRHPLAPMHGPEGTRWA